MKIYGYRMSTLKNFLDISKCRCNSLVKISCAANIKKVITKIRSINSLLATLHLLSVIACYGIEFNNLQNITRQNFLTTFNHMRKILILVNKIRLLRLTHNRKYYRRICLLLPKNEK